MSISIVPAQSPSRLFSTLLSAYKAPIIYGILPRIALIALNFSQPFLINRAVNLSMQPINEGSTNAGYGMIGAYALVYIGIAVCYHANRGLMQVFESTDVLSSSLLVNTSTKLIAQSL